LATEASCLIKESILLNIDTNTAGQNGNGEENQCDTNHEPENDLEHTCVLVSELSASRINGSAGSEQRGDSNKVVSSLLLLEEARVCGKNKHGGFGAEGLHDGIDHGVDGLDLSGFCAVLLQDEVVSCTEVNNSDLLLENSRASGSSGGENVVHDAVVKLCTVDGKGVLLSQVGHIDVEREEGGHQ